MVSVVRGLLATFLFSFCVAIIVANAGAVRTAASVKNTTHGNPGIIANTHSIAPATSRAFGCLPICCPISRPKLVLCVSSVTRVTMIPAVMEMNNAGICPIKPSPIVRIE